MVLIIEYCGMKRREIIEWYRSMGIKAPEIVAAAGGRVSQGVVSKWLRTGRMVDAGEALLWVLMPGFGYMGGSGVKKMWEDSAPDGSGGTGIYRKVSVVLDDPFVKGLRDGFVEDVLEVGEAVINPKTFDSVTVVDPLPGVFDSEGNADGHGDEFPMAENGVPNKWGIIDGEGGGVPVEKKVVRLTPSQGFDDSLIGKRVVRGREVHFGFEDDNGGGFGGWCLAGALEGATHVSIGGKEYGINDFGLL